MLAKTTSASIAVIMSATLCYAESSTCNRKLSVLEADVSEMSNTLARASKQLLEVANSFAADEVAAQRALACPVEVVNRLDAHRSTIAAFAIEGAVVRADDNVECTQYFSGRVEIDIQKATNDSNARMVQSLAAISRRISEIDTLATQQSGDATFLASKKGRLLQGVNAIDELCQALGGVYE